MVLSEGGQGAWPRGARAAVRRHPRLRERRCGRAPCAAHRRRAEVRTRGVRDGGAARGAGNCVWYDEPGLLRQAGASIPAPQDSASEDLPCRSPPRHPAQVETLLGKAVERMPPSLQLRPELLSVKFGEEANGASQVSPLLRPPSPVRPSFDHGLHLTTDHTVHPAARLTAAGRVDHGDWTARRA